MLKASEARKISNGYNAEAANRMKNCIEKLIMQRAECGIYWAAFDYGYDMCENGVTKKEVYQICCDLRSAGYDVKDHWTFREMIIRW